MNVLDPVLKIQWEEFCKNVLKKMFLIKMARKVVPGFFNVEKNEKKFI